MPTHPFFGTYTLDNSVPDEAYAEFAPLLLGGREISLIIYGFGKVVAEEDVERFAVFCQQMSAHVVTARTGLSGEYWDSVTRELIEDLALSNPKMDILSEMFPGQALNTMDRVTTAHGAVEYDVGLLRAFGRAIGQWYRCVCR
ncbi:MAG: hypothetical protein AAFQ77_01470 [Myxococcota bacterium]